MLQDQQSHHQSYGFAGAVLLGVIVPAEFGLEDIPADLVREDVQRMLSVKLFFQPGKESALGCRSGWFVHTSYLQGS